MAKKSPRLNDFRSGEMTPGLGARSDLAAYSKGCILMKNCMPLVEGKVERVPGTRFLRTVKQTEEGWGLRITRSGSGSGDVDSNPVGIDCGPTCYTFFADGASIGLTAEAEPNSSFVGWSGDGTGTPIRTVVMNGNKVVNAKFEVVMIYQATTPTIPSGFRWFRILNKDYSVSQDIQLRQTDVPGSAVGAVRENARREKVYVDNLGYIYLMFGGNSIDYKIQFVKMHLHNFDYTRLEITAGDNPLGFTDGYIVDDVGYFAKYSSISSPKIYKVHLPSLTVQATAGVGQPQPAYGVLVAPDYDYIYELSDQYNPNFRTMIRRYRLSTFLFVDTINPVAAGSLGLYRKYGFIRVGDFIYYLSYTSTSVAGGPGRLVRVTLPNITGVVSLILPSGVGLSLNIDSAGVFGYALSATYIYKINLATMLVADQIVLPFALSNAAMTINENDNRLYISSYVKTALLVYTMNPLTFVEQLTRSFGFSIFLK